MLVNCFENHFEVDVDGNFLDIMKWITYCCRANFWYLLLPFSNISNDFFNILSSQIIITYREEHSIKDTTSRRNAVSPTIRSSFTKFASGGSDDFAKDKAAMSIRQTKDNWTESSMLCSLLLRLNFQTQRSNFLRYLSRCVNVLIQISFAGVMSSFPGNICAIEHTKHWGKRQ